MINLTVIIHQNIFLDGKKKYLAMSKQSIIEIQKKYLKKIKEIDFNGSNQIRSLSSKRNNNRFEARYY